VAKALESICNIQASHIGYTKTCNTSIYKDETVTNVGDVLALLCDINAGEVSYKKPADCSRLTGVTTVQGAIDELCKVNLGDSCCVPVGVGAEYETIGEAITELVIKGGKLDVCICVKPGLYKEDKLKVSVPNLRLKISGSGRTARMRMEGNWLFENLSYIHLDDIELASNELESPLQFIACRDVNLTSCVIEGRFEKGALVAVHRAEHFNIHNCQLAAEKPDTQEKTLVIFDKLLDAGAPPRTIEAREAVLALYKLPDQFEFEASRLKVANIMAQLGELEQTRLLPLSERVLKSAEEERFLEPAELRLFRDLVNLLLQKTNAREALIANRLNDIRLAVAASADLTVVALGDGFADTQITNSRMFGNIGLYGTADQPTLDDGAVKILAARVRERRIRFPSHNGRLHCLGNSFRRFWLSQNMYKRLQAVVDGEDADFPDSFSGFTASDNVYRANQSWFFSRFLTFTSNDFDFELKDPPDRLMATAVDENAIYTANRGPDASSFDAVALIRNLGYVNSVSTPNMMLAIDK
jgi:hypothetical protein